MTRMAMTRLRIISGVRIMEQEQRSGDQNRGLGHSDSTTSHSHEQEWDEKCWASGHEVLSRVSSAQTQVHVSLSTRARPGHARGWHAHAHWTSSVTWAQAVSHTPSLYTTNTLSFLGNNCKMKCNWTFMCMMMNLTFQINWIILDKCNVLLKHLRLESCTKIIII